MVRKVIKIDEEKCTGCGICANACHEGAIDIIDGKARLVRENFCDGFGDCLPACPAGAISFEEREAPQYDAAAVAAAKRSSETPHAACPGSQMRILSPAPSGERNTIGTAAVPAVRSQLANWPPEIKLAPVQAPYYRGADLLIAADCTAYSYGDFHREFMRGRVTLIGCPKLDAVDYSEKLTGIIRNNPIRSLTVTRMEVPCCGGLEMAVKKALRASGKTIPLQVITIGISGEILERKDG